MILQSLEPTNWGPFDNSTKLSVEDDVTVITGSNDTGKTSLLRLIDAMYRFPNQTEGGVKEYDLNFDFRDSSKIPDWQKQTEFGCRATFRCQSNTSQYLGGVQQGLLPKPNDLISVVFNLAPGSRSSLVYLGTQLIGNNGAVTHMPHVIGLPTGHLIGETVNMAAPNHIESRLLQIAFGRGFSAAKLKNYSPAIYNSKIGQARERLRSAARRVLPSSTNLTIDLQSVGTAQQEVVIQPIDLEFGFSPLASRGTGIRTLLALLGGLLEADNIDENLLIYIDEPETSLHADAQHSLRALLEELGSHPSVQVLYATHSSSMINNMRPHNIRLLKRTLQNEKVITKVIDRPIDSNFLAVRSSLGMSPADSLLYAPISVIVEGVTDSICLPLLLRRLHDFHVVGFEELDKIIPMCHILDGEGDSYLYQIKLAKSQGSRPIVFLDGDKVVSNEEKTEHLDTIFIRIEDKKELEELVPLDLYISAYQSLLKQDGQDVPESLTAKAFKAWEANLDDRARTRAFTKRIDRWLYETQQTNWDIKKPRVMKKAIELVNSADQINHAQLLELLRGIASLLPSTR